MVKIIFEKRFEKNCFNTTFPTQNSKSPDQSKGWRRYCAVMTGTISSFRHTGGEMTPFNPCTFGGRFSFFLWNLDLDWKNLLGVKSVHFIPPLRKASFQTRANRFSHSDFFRSFTPRASPSGWKSRKKTSCEKLRLRPRVENSYLIENPYANSSVRKSPFSSKKRDSKTRFYRNFGEKVKIFREDSVQRYRHDKITLPQIAGIYRKLRCIRYRKVRGQRCGRTVAVFRKAVGSPKSQTPSSKEAPNPKRQTAAACG